MILGLGLTRADGRQHCVSPAEDAPCADPGCEEGFTWDTSRCECLCDERECPRDWHWDTETCRCERD